MNSHDILGAAQALQQKGLAYALVSVLRVQAPASARPGDKAVVTAEGISAGWIGGGCAQPAVMRTVRLALQDGQARVIRIAPARANDGADAGAESQLRQLDDVLEFGMACHSGGTLELFVDPMLPRARLTVIGDTPLAAALVALAPRVGLPVTLVAQGADAARFPDADRVIASDEPATAAAALARGSFVVVATQGRRDVQGLRAALALQAARVFFVASAKKGAVLKAALLEAGSDAAAVAAIVAPAGQPIGAQTPEEIALSVLAAVVAARRGLTPQPESRPEALAASLPAPLPEPLPEPGREPGREPKATAGSCCGGKTKPAVEAVPAITSSGSCCGG